MKDFAIDSKNNIIRKGDKVSAVGLEGKIVKIFPPTERTRRVGVKFPFSPRVCEYAPDQLTKIEG